VKIFSANKESIDQALARIKGIVAVPEVGETYEGTVKSVMPYGAFVEFLPGKQGLLHISEISWSRLDTLEGVMKEGDTVKIKLVGTDPKTGKFRLSRKVLMPKPEGYVEKEESDGGQRRDRGERRDRGDRKGGDRGDRRRDGGNRDRGERRENGNEEQPKMQEGDTTTSSPAGGNQDSNDNDADLTL